MQFHLSLALLIYCIILRSHHTEVWSLDYCRCLHQSRYCYGIISKFIILVNDEANLFFMESITTSADLQLFISRYYRLARITSEKSQ